MGKTIERLEDMKGMKADEFVEVHLIYEFDGRKVTLSNHGIVYNIGLDRFSLIGPIMGCRTVIGRINYDWKPQNETFDFSIDGDQPFDIGSPEYERYESLLNQNLNQTAA